MADDNSADINLNLNGDAGPLKEQLEQVKGILDDVNEDANTYMQIMSDTEGRHQSILSSWKDILQAIRDSNSALQSLNATEQAQSTAMSNFRQEIQEILQSVKGLGGNINHVMSIFQASGGRGISGMGGAGISMGSGAYDISTAPMDYSSRAGVSTGIDTSAIDIGGSTRASRFAGRIRGRRAVLGGEEVGDETIAGEYAPGVSRVREISPGTPRQASLRDQLSEYGGLNVPAGKEYRAASYSMDSAMSTLNNTVGNLPAVGRPIMNAIKRSLEMGGVNRRSLRFEEQGNTTLSEDPITGQTIATREGNYTEVEKKALGFANKVAEIFGNKFIKGFAEYGGFATMGVQAAYDIAAKARQFTGFAQSQGQVFGMTDYSRTVGMTADAFFKSDFGLNPTFSAAQVMQNQMMGASLGLKGSQLNDYVNNALTMQTTYGLDAQQANQLLGAGLGVGVSMNANMQGISMIRNMENATTMSTAYGNMAYTQGMTTAAGMGASGLESALQGAFAATFGQNNMIAAKAGITATEAATGTQLGNVFLAQQLGTNYMNLYSAMATASGNGTLIPAEVAVNTRILAMAGIDVSNQSSTNNWASLDPYVVRLFNILQSLGMTNIKQWVDAKTWAIDVLQQQTVANSKGNNTPMTPTTTLKSLSSTIAGINQTLRLAEGAAGSRSPTAYATAETAANTATKQANMIYDTLNNQLGQKFANLQQYNPTAFTAAEGDINQAITAYNNGNFAAGMNAVNQAMTIYVELKKDAKKALKVTPTKVTKS
jgi:hypothetical protein